MGWWREGNNLIGDGPADRVAMFLNGWIDRDELGLGELLCAIDKALRRNPQQFVSDTASVDGQLVALSTEGAIVWQAREVPHNLVEGCHNVIEEIAMEYLENSLEQLPTCSELLGTFRFVITPLIPKAVKAPSAFDLQRVAYESGDYRILRGIRLQCLEQVVADFGMKRDRDASPQGDPLEFASWTRHPDLSLEVDWHAPSEGPHFVEIRGTDASRLACELVEACGGTVTRDPEEALTDLLTVPPREVPASAPAAQARWEMLCVAAMSGGGFDELPGRALVSAGLADSDWRVRMVAVWAVGHHRISGLAAKTEAAALPKTGYKGLGQEDRRVLLALRDLAAARSAGRPDVVKPGANAGFVAKVASIIDSVPEHAGDRAEVLVKVLLRCQLTNDDIQIPSAWKTWIGAPSA